MKFRKYILEHTEVEINQLECSDLNLFGSTSSSSYMNLWIRINTISSRFTFKQTFLMNVLTACSIEFDSIAFWVTVITLDLSTKSILNLELFV